MKNDDMHSEFENGKSKLFEAYPILNEINNGDNLIIEKNALFKKLYSGELLSSYEESCSGFLFVIDGNIKIQKLTEDGAETNLYNIGKGELCHEALRCVLKREQLNILGKAVQDSEICIIPWNIVEKYLLQNVMFLHALYEDLYSKFTVIIENKEQRMHETVDKRLINLLKNKKSNIIYATHSELAFELDSAREVISRKLKKLEKDKYIKISRGKIQILKELTELI